MNQNWLCWAELRIMQSSESAPFPILTTIVPVHNLTHLFQKLNLFVRYKIMHFENALKVMQLTCIYKNLNIRNLIGTTLP